MFSIKSLCLISLFANLFFLPNSLAKNNFRKKGIIISKKKKSQRGSYNRSKVNNSETSSISEEERFKKLKDRMTPLQFKELWTFWNKAQMSGISSNLTTNNLLNLKKEIDDLEKQKRIIEQTITSYRQKLEELKKVLENLMGKNPRKRKKKKLFKAKIMEVQQTINELQKELQEKMESLKLITTKLNELKDKLNTSQKDKNIITKSELILMDSIKLDGLDSEQKYIVEALRKKINDVINGYEKTGSLEKSQYNDLIETIKKLTSLLKKYNGPSRSLDFDKPLIHKGIVFKVQLAALKNRNLANLGQTSPNDVLEQETKGNIHYYTLRTFRNYWEANEFKKHMREIMGFNNKELPNDKLKSAPHIVAYKDGERIPMKDALEIIKSQKKIS